MAEKDVAETDTPSAVPDVLAPGLDVVFCGINPGRVSAAAAAHFANPRNDFWRLLHDAGFTPRLLGPAEQYDALRHGIGITNAAYRTTPGSGDLRAGDFDGSRDRLELLAADLRPRAIGFVGKEAYRGVFRERPQLGLQERRLGDTALFVLPSTSPANAAVPYAERLRWFRAPPAPACVSALPWRQGARALVLDPADRVLLVHFDFEPFPWSPPGGGVDPGESDEHALRRELAEEVGLDAFAIGPLLWRREHEWDLAWNPYRGQRERCYLVRVDPFEPAPRLDLAAEHVSEVRWWTPAELDASAEVFGPRALPRLVRRLLADGPPAEPLELGV